MFSRFCSPYIPPLKAFHQLLCSAFQTFFVFYFHFFIASDLFIFQPSFYAFFYCSMVSYMAREMTTERPVFLFDMDIGEFRVLFKKKNRGVPC